MLQQGYDQLCGENEHLNIIIAATLNGAVTALDGETGELLWRYQDAPMLQGTLNNAGVSFSKEKQKTILDWKSIQ